MNAQESKKGEAGFALVVVILVLLLASFLASQLTMQTKEELQVAHNVKMRAIGHFLAESGITLGLFRLLDKPVELADPSDEESYRFFMPGYVYEFYLPKGKVSYMAVNESGKIDMKKADSKLLRLFLEYHLGEGVDQEKEIDTIVASMQDWQDEDDLYRETESGARGGESETYGALAEPYLARNAPFRDPDEFFLVNGTAPLAGKFVASDVFTVQNTDGKVNFNNLTEAMLDFLVAGDPEKKALYRESQELQEGRLSSANAQEILGEDRFSILSGYLDYQVQSNAANSFFYLVAVGEAGLTAADVAQGREEEKRRHIPGIKTRVLIRKDGTRLTTLSWQESYI